MTESVFCPAGISDPTPAQAIRKEHINDSWPGEVWTDTSGNYELILAVNKGFSTVLWLNLNDKLPDQVVLPDGKRMYTNVCMLSYMLMRNYGEKVYALDDASFDNILRSSRASLGVEAGNLETMRQEINELRAERDEYRKENTILYVERNAAQMAAGVVERMKRHIAALKQEIGAYKRTCRILANELRYTKPTAEEDEQDDED